MFRILATIVALTAIVSSTEAVQTRPCSNNRPHPALVTVEGCSEMPCDLMRGTNHSVKMAYIAPFDARTLQSRREITLFGIAATYPQPEFENACDWLTGASCPVQQGELLISNIVSFILPMMPLVHDVFEVSVVDEENRTHACVEMDMKIVPSA